MTREAGCGVYSSTIVIVTTHGVVVARDLYQLSSSSAWLWPWPWPWWSRQFHECSDVLVLKTQCAWRCTGPQWKSDVDGLRRLPVTGKYFCFFSKQIFNTTPPPTTT